VAQDEPARIRQRHRARAARPLDQLRTDQSLQGRDLLRDRRLGVAEAFRGAAEARLLGDRLERGQMTQFDPEPSIEFHDHHEL
jgi:hypothetical protein